MVWRLTHTFLKWLPPSLFGLVAFLVVSSIGAAEVWPEAKSSAGKRWAAAISLLEHPLIWVALVAAICAWLGGLLWSGEMARRFEQRVVRPKRKPLYKALQWISKDSVWAERYNANDEKWVIGLQVAIQRELSLGGITAFGYRRLEHLALGGGLNAIPCEFWAGATLDISHIAMFYPPTSAKNERTEYDLIEVDWLQVLEAFPERSKIARSQGKSPVKRIGYKDLWATHDVNYAIFCENARKTALEHLYG